MIWTATYTETDTHHVVTYEGSASVGASVIKAGPNVWDAMLRVIKNEINRLDPDAKFVDILAPE